MSMSIAKKIDGWEPMVLGKVLKYEQPYKYAVDSTNYNADSGIPVLTAGKSFILGYTNETHNVYNNFPVIIFDDFTTDSKYVDFPFKVKSSAMKFLKERNKDEVSLKFAFEILQALKLQSTGGDHKRRWISEYSKIEIAAPGYKEQTRIAEILSTADEAITNTEALIAKYQRIKTGLMQDLLTKGIDEHGNIRSKATHKFVVKNGIEVPEEWEVYTIEEITDHVGSGVTPKGGSNVYTHSGVMLIRSQNVLVGKFDFSDVAFISEEVNAKMKRSELQELDVLLNITGASIGRSHYVPENFQRANVNQHVCALRLKNRSLGKSVFLSTYLNDFKGQNQIKRLLGASNREGLNYQQIREIKVAMPNIETDNEFNRIMKTLSACETTIQDFNTNLSKLQSIKTGLMQDLLSGKVRVKV